jgi:putative MATE family efflux protein
MLQESLKQRVKKLAVPIFIETMLVMMLGAVDTFMLSYYSDNSVAAVGMVNQLMNLAFLVFQVIALGTAVLCSQYIGARQEKQTIQVVGISLLANTLIGIVVSIILLAFSKSILLVMGLRPELMSDGLSYMKITGSCSFFMAISMTLSASFRSANKANYPMIVTMVVNVLNFIGNYALIFGKLGMPQMGVEGAALSTAICRGIAVALLFVLLFKKHIRKFPLEWFKPFPFPELKNLFKIGIPSAVEQLSYSLSQVVIVYFINYISNEALTARTYSMNLIMFTYLLTLSMGQAAAIVIGQLVGEQKTQAAFVLGKYSMKLSVLLSVSFSLLLALLGKLLFPLLTDNAEILRIGLVILWIDIILEMGRALNISLVNSLRSTGDVYFPSIVGLIVMWGVSVAGSYLLGIHWGFGLVGMWWAFVLDENIRGVIFIKRWYSFKWAKKGFV